MAEEQKKARSSFNTAVMLGTYLICVSIPIYYYLVDYPNYDHDCNAQIIWSLFAFPLYFLGKLVMLIMGLVAVLAMGAKLNGLGGFIFIFLFLGLSYGPYIFLFWHARKPKNRWLMYLFILWSAANAIGFLYNSGCFKKSKVDKPRDFMEVRDLRR